MTTGKTISRSSVKAKDERRQKSAKNPRVKYPTIGADAEALGVTRQHLWEVLQGRRNSKRLLLRYNQLVQEAA